MNVHNRQYLASTNGHCNLKLCDSGSERGGRTSNSSSVVTLWSKARISGATGTTGWEQLSRVCENHAGSVPVFFTATTAEEGPTNAAVELHSVLSALHICVDSTCATHGSSGVAQ